MLRFATYIVTLLFGITGVAMTSPCVFPELRGKDGIDSVLYNGIVSFSETSMDFSDTDNSTSNRTGSGEVDLGNVHYVTEVTVHSSRSENIRYSRDGFTWKTSPTGHSRFPARYLRIETTGSDDVSVEVRGCLLSRSVTIIDDDLQLGENLWFAKNNPFLVTNNITIGSSSSLTLCPGVKVVFDHNAWFIVKGSLILSGTEKKKINITALSAKSTAGITIVNGAVSMNHTVTGPGFILLTPRQNTSSVNLTINNSMLDVDVVDIKASMLTVHISNSEMKYRFIEVKVLNQTNFNQSGHSSLLLNTTEQEKRRNGTIYITNSTISGRISSPFTGSVFSIQSESNVEPHRLVIYASRIRKENWMNVTSTNETFNVILRENVFGGSVSVKGLFSNVIISANNFSTNGSSLVLRFGKEVRRRRDNDLLASHRFGAHGLNWRQEKLYRTTNVTAKVTLAGNRFTGSQVRVTCPYTLVDPVSIRGNVFNQTVLILGTPDVAIMRNLFIRRSPQLIYNGTIYSPREIYAGFNYWGCQSTALIKRKIIDYAINTDLPKIHFMPYYKDRALKTLVEDVSFISCDGNTLGGHLGGEVVLRRDTGPYTAVSDIFVRENETLTIEAGVKILFKEGVGFTVDGSLFIEGSPEKPVELLSETRGKPWRGLILGPKRRPAVRLSGGSDEREGTVLVWTRSKYGPMCSWGEFNDSQARVICRMAGYDPSGGVSVRPLQTFSGGMSSRVHYSYGRINCNGTEQDLIYCDRDSAYCSFSTGEADKPSVRCLGKKLSDGETVSASEIKLLNVIVKDTLQGIIIVGNVSLFENVTSSQSRTAGLTFDPGFKGDHLHVVKNLDSSFNQDGVVLTSDKPYRKFRFEGCRVNRNEGSGFRFGGYPNVFIGSCDISNNNNGVYSDHHNITSVTIDSSVVHDNKNHAVYLKSEEVIPILLWANVYRSTVFLSITNSSFSLNDMTYRNWSRYWNSDDCMICVHSSHGAVNIQANSFRNINVRNTIVLGLRSSTFSIQDNVFEKNTVYNILYVYSLSTYGYYSYPPLTNSTGSITGNEIRGNLGVSMVAMTIEDNYMIDVSDNALVNNNATFAIVLDGRNVSVVNNTMINVDATCEIFSPIESNVLTAERNNNFNLSDSLTSHSEVCKFFRYNPRCQFCLRRVKPDDVTTTPITMTT